MAVFTINLLLQFYRPLFLSTLLAPKRVQKAQHRQNQSYRPFAHEFSRAKISLGWALLVSNFPHRKTTRECVSLAAPRRAKKLSHSYPRLLLRPLPVILTVLYFFESNLCKRNSPSSVRGTTRVSVVCDDGRFIFPKESRACEAPEGGGS